VRMADATILVVEDDPNDVLLLRRAFAKAKLANPLQVVGDGDAAVDYLSGAGAYADRSAHPLPTMILLDLKLPRRSGHEVLEWLRAQPSIGRIPVVVLTSSRQSADIDRAYDLGANSYLVKPVQFDGLLEMVKNMNLYWFVMNERPSVDGRP
jgi:CheY-like chemotaxis protein